MSYQSQHRWSHGDREFELNNFPHSAADGWTYELYEVDGQADRNDFVEFRIPDLTPVGPFTPAPRSQVQFLAHGEPVIPLVLLERLIALAEEYGHLLPADA